MIYCPIHKIKENSSLDLTAILKILEKFEHANVINVEELILMFVD